MHAMLDAMLDDLQEMVSYRKNVTGVNHTLFISPRGHARHGPRVKVAIDPPHSLNPQCRTASIDLNGHVVAGDIDPALLEQVRSFIIRNQDALLAYWNYEIDTHELGQRLR